MLSEIEYKKLAWHSRRGMLELDLLLEPFVRERLQCLDTAEQQLYRQLLTHEDQDLYSWLVERTIPAEAELSRIIRLIRAHAGHPGMV
ncbi:MAG: succinate dehydrogenase assembly factor 2 [Pseudomonadales bacterium]|nr:succinate dehydrogenase assembly factor 2 [Pseudomonadales bacterium]